MNRGLFSNNEDNKYSRGEIIYSVSKPNNYCLRLNGQSVPLFQRGINKTFAQKLSSTGFFSWSEPVSLSPNIVNSVAFGNNLWVVGAEQGQIRTSTDSITWVTRTSNFGITNINSVAFGNNLWVAVGSAGQIRTSTDAITWVTRTSNFGATAINFVAFGNNLWVAVGNNGQIRSSTDGVTWVTRTSNFGTTAVNSVAFGNSLWVAVGSTGQIRTSTDAITWVTRTGAGTATLGQVKNNNRIFIATSSSTLFISTDGITWIRRPTPFTSGMACVGMTSNLYFIGTSSNQIASSVDAINWTVDSKFSNIANQFVNDIAFANGIWIFVGKTGITTKILNKITPPSITYGWVQS